MMKTMLKIKMLIILSGMGVHAQNSLAYLSDEMAEENNFSVETLKDVPELAVSDKLDEQNKLSELIIPANEVKQFGFEYFPLSMDISYLYDSNAGETESAVSPNGDEFVLSFDAGKISYEQQFFKGEDGIYLTRTESSALIFFGTTVTYPEPVLRLPLPLQIGKKWKWEGFEIADGDTGKLTIEGEALAEEVITTTIGPFSCLKIQLMIESEHGSKNTVTEWLAPGIGVVKFHALLEGTGLTAFLQDIFGLDELTFDLTGVVREDKSKI